jgi:flagellar biosynthesis protein FlhA
VVDPPTVITTHLTEIIKDTMAELLTYSETQKLLDDLTDDYQKLVSDMIPSQFSVATLQRILQLLLAERVSIRDLPSIIEAIGEAIRATTNVVFINEIVRSRLSRQISAENTLPEGYIPVVNLSARWEQDFAESLVGSGEERQLTLAPSKIQEFISQIRRSYDQYALQGQMPVLLTSPTVRPYVRSIIERFRPSIIILSQNEIHAKAKIKTIGQI